MTSDKRWKVTRCPHGRQIAEDAVRMNELLASGWEPFAVTPDGNGAYVYHLRRWTAPWIPDTGPR